MQGENKEKKAAKVGLVEHEIKVLLVDDQAMIGEAVRRMLAPEADIHFFYCNDPGNALKMADEVKPTIILQDLVMPQIDGLTLVKYYRVNPVTRDVPLIVLSTKEEATTKAEAFSLGANDYLVKLPDRIELVARIRYHSKGYINLLQRNEVYDALLASQKALEAELAEAADYVHSLLPPPLTEGPVRTCWQFIPSTELGGDAFGYHWLDDDHIGLFLLDVCGHGVGAALLSISAMNVLRSQTLANTDFKDPGSTLTALNEAFLMEKHNNMYFTIWYGVYGLSTRELCFASAGHPPALFVEKTPDGQVISRELSTKGALLGAMGGMSYTSDRCRMPDNGVLFLMSDGTYEVTLPDESMWTYQEFAALLQNAHAQGKSEIEELVATVRGIRGQGALEDDFSIMRVQFLPSGV